MNRPAARSLPFRKIPRQPEVFLKYLDADPDILPFFRHRPTIEALRQSAGDVLLRTFPRSQIADILRRQNEAFGGDDPVRRAIDDLEKPDSVAIVTGQQVGLFTGPVLTIYKALTALRLSEEMRHRGINAVPIFWMASDDHDLAEITQIAVCDPGANTRRLDARPALFGKAALPPHPVGTIRLPESIERVLEEYAASFAGLELGETVRTQLASAYRPGNTFAGAFGRLMTDFLRGRGLVQFDPRDPDAKRLAAPVLLKALQEVQGLRTRLAERIRALEHSGLQAQVPALPRATLVFYEAEGERRLLVTKDGGFAIKDAGRNIGLEELSELARSAPERFSPNVLLRPVVQDHLFPTIAYVGGPAEISYFAEVEPLYRFYDRPMPVVWPRSSFTVLDEQICSNLERRGLQLEDCFQGDRHVTAEILKSVRPKCETLLAALHERAEQGLSALKSNLSSVDPSLGPAADTIQRKLLHRVGSLRTRFINYEMRRDTVLADEVRSLMSHCCPNGNLQERELGAACLLARYGPPLLDTLYRQIDLDSFSHQILCL